VLVAKQHSLNATTKYAFREVIAVTGRAIVTITVTKSDAVSFCFFDDKNKKVCCTIQFAILEFIVVLVVANALMLYEVKIERSVRRGFDFLVESGE